MPNSWIHLGEQNAAYALPSEFASSDPFGARDCGWVEQMRPFIREFTRRGDRVLDAFCGFGSTLVAAALEGRQSVGIEIEESRYRIARKRLDTLSLDQATVMRGDSESLAAGLAPVDLVLTSLPYFGCGFDSDNDGQLYQAGTYGAYLEKIRTTLVALKSALKPGGYLVVAVENIRLGTQFIPQAWDVAKLIMARFDFIEDRIIVYDKPHQDSMSPRSNRAHEYVFIARHGPRGCDLETSLTTVKQLHQAFPEMLLIGSFARWLVDPLVEPSDVDLLMPNDTDLIREVVRWLEAASFRITRWGAPVSASMAAIASEEAKYFRAERLDSDGRRVALDVSFSESPDGFTRLTSCAQWFSGMPCITEALDLD